MPTHDPDKILEDLRATQSKLCYYPSSGHRNPWMPAGLDADVFVFSDYEPKNAEARKRFWDNFQRGFARRGLFPVLEISTVKTRVFRFGRKRGFLFFQDNNEVLARIAAAGWKINSYVGICDGCCEGGNYECVHDDPFLSKLLDTAAEEGMDYITDHSRLLCGNDSMHQSNVEDFRRTVGLPSGWDFALQSILFRDEDDAAEPWKTLLFPEGGSVPARMTGGPMAAFVPRGPIRRQQMLAHYRVNKR